MIRAALVAASLLSLGASHRTENFLVTAPTAEFAVSVAESAERFRRDLAVEWLGRELPAWQDKCPIQVHVGPQYGAGGTTSFMFRDGKPFGWRMSIQGSPARILDSVLPHEVTHTIFATHFGGPLPRWADEGACTTVEHHSEKQKQHDMLYEFLTTQRGIAFNDMFAMKQYPADIMPLYAQGYSLARFLIAQGGKRKFIRYVGDGMKWDNWPKATEKHYDFPNLSQLQITWLAWVRRGSPEIATREVSPPAPLIAQASAVESDVVPVSRPAPHGKPRGSRTPVTLVSATANDSQEGWYTRIRDEAFARSTQEPAERPHEREADTPAPPQTVTRPQPIGRPKQIVLEWSRPATYPGPAPQASPQTRVLPSPSRRTTQLIPNFGQTLWR